jgi:hypothetical protein
VGFVFNIPILTDQVQQPRGMGFLRAQTGDQPDDLDFPFAVFEFADLVQERHLEDVRKIHLRGCNLHYFVAAPFDAAIPFINLE